MSRRNKAVKRPVPPDPRYDSQTVSKFVNNLMFEGKKSVAEGIFYSAMDMIEERTGQPGVSVFKQAVNNAKPTLEVKSRRVGGASLQVPVEVRPDRRTALAMRWLISFSRARTEKTMSERLAAELILASQGRGEHDQEEGRHPPDGRGQPGVRALSLVAGARERVKKGGDADRRPRPSCIGNLSPWRNPSGARRVAPPWSSDSFAPGCSPSVRRRRGSASRARSRSPAISRRCARTASSR